MAEEGYPVDLYIYDLSHGFASLLAPAIIGRTVEGVWHTSVVVYEREYFFGGSGITSCAPGSTQLGAPHSVERLGRTFVPFSVFVEYVEGLARSTYSGAAYSLLEHNCNHFSEEVAQFLCGAHIPKHILHQPELLPPQHRAALQSLLDTLVPTDSQAVYSEGVRHARSDSPDFVTLNSQIEEASPSLCPWARVSNALRRAWIMLRLLRLLRALPPLHTPKPTAQSAQLEARRSTLADKLARKERRRDKKRKKHQREHPDEEVADDTEMAEAQVSASGAEALGAAGPSALDDDEREQALRRARDPPIIYTDIDGLEEHAGLVKALSGVELSPERQQSVEELRLYLAGEGSWVLGDDFPDFIGSVLGGGCAAARVALLRCLAAAAPRDDVSLLLHADRRARALLSYAHGVDAAPPAEARALALFLVNLFESPPASEWLLYISEWQANNQTLSNIRVTTKVCVHCTLAEDPELRELGTALLHNLATKEVKTVRFQAGKPLRDLLPKHAKSKVFDEVCVELCMALLQLLQLAPSEEHLWRALRALARLAQHSHDVPQLVAMVGPDPASFRGTSARIDEQIDIIMKKVKG